MGRAARRDEEAMRSFVEQMARLLADFGLPRMAGRVLFAIMAADERALTAGDLATRLSVSPAAISGAVRLLIQLNMVVREPVANSRRDVYRLLDDSWYEVTLTKLTMLKSLIDIVDQGVRAAGGAATPAGARLAEMRDFYMFVRERMPQLLDEWAATRSPPNAKKA